MSNISMTNKVIECIRVSLFVDKNTAVYFDSFWIDYIPQEVLSKTKDKAINNNIFRIQDDDSVMCEFP